MVRMERKEINEKDTEIQNTCSEEKEEGDGVCVFRVLCDSCSCVSDSVALLLL
jgi:hypothetical protein